jgi:hypothetical protein
MYRCEWIVAAAVLAAASSACSGGDDKNACETQLDCVEGYLCELPEGGGTGTCEPIDGWPSGDDDDDDGQGGPPDPDGGVNFVDASGGGGSEFGSFESFSAATGGSTSYGPLHVAVTTLTGGLGCALVGDQDAAPGRKASQVYAVLDADIYTCPSGSYGLRSASACAQDYEGYIPDDCALFRAWNEDGEQVAQLFATGGSLTVVGNGEQCTMTLDMSFPGGNVTETFSFYYYDDYDTDTYCSE